MSGTTRLLNPKKKPEMGADKLIEAELKELRVALEKVTQERDDLRSKLKVQTVKEDAQVGGCHSCVHKTRPVDEVPCSTCVHIISISNNYVPAPKERP